MLFGLSFNFNFVEGAKLLEAKGAKLYFLFGPKLNIGIYIYIYMLFIFFWWSQRGPGRGPGLLLVPSLYTINII